MSHGEVRDGDSSILTLISGPGLLSSHPDQTGFPSSFSVARGHQECCLLAVLAVLYIINIDHSGPVQSSHPSDCVVIVMAVKQFNNTRSDL